MQRLLFESRALLSVRRRYENKTTFYFVNAHSVGTSISPLSSELLCDFKPNA